MGDAVERIGSGSWPGGFAMGHQHPDGIEPIPLLARESEPIVPPLRSITAPCAKSVYSREFANFAQVPLPVPRITVPISVLVASEPLLLVVSMKKSRVSSSGR